MTIYPATGQVTGWIDLFSRLNRDELAQAVDVHNDMAFDAGGDRLFVTGKLRLEVSEIELVEE